MQSGITKRGLRAKVMFCLVPDHRAWGRHLRPSSLSARTRRRCRSSSRGRPSARTEASPHDSAEISRPRVCEPERKKPAEMSSGNFWAHLLIKAASTILKVKPEVPLTFLSAFLLSDLLALISAPTGFHDWESVTRWARLLITLLTTTYPTHKRIKVWWVFPSNVTIWSLFTSYCVLCINEARLGSFHL